MALSVDLQTRSEPILIEIPSSAISPDRKGMLPTAQGKMNK